MTIEDRFGWIVAALTVAALGLVGWLMWEAWAWVARDRLLRVGLALTWTVLAVADVLMTLRALRRGAVEVNPVMRASQRLFGRDGGIVIAKVLAVGVMWWALPDVPVWIVALGAAVHLYWALRGFKK